MLKQINHIRQDHCIISLQIIINFSFLLLFSFILHDNEEKKNEGCLVIVAYKAIGIYQYQNKTILYLIERLKMHKSFYFFFSNCLSNR